MRQFLYSHIVIKYGYRMVNIYMECCANFREPDFIIIIIMIFLCVFPLEIICIFNLYVVMQLRITTSLCHNVCDCLRENKPSLQLVLTRQRSPFQKFN